MKRIAVTGGKGGTGKSTVATALAFELNKKHKVLLVDADADCPNDHLLLGIERKKIETVFQRIPKWDYNKCIGCGKCAKACNYNAIAMINKKPFFMPKQCNGCGACVYSCPVNAISWSKKETGVLFNGKKHNITLLSGELKTTEPFTELITNALNKKIEKMKKKHEFVIVDTAAGIHCNVINALEKADLVFAVTEPTPLGAHDLELILNVLEKLELDSKIVLNRAGIGKSSLIESIAEKYKKEIIARIPYSKKIMESYSKGIPVTHKSIEKIAGLFQ